MFRDVTRKIFLEAFALLYPFEDYIFVRVKKSFASPVTPWKLCAPATVSAVGH